MAAALGGEGVDAAAGVAVGVTTAGATPSEAAGSLAAAAGMLDAPTAAAGGDVGGAAAAASVAPPASLFGPHFLLRATSHLVYVAVTVAILFQVYVSAGIAALFFPCSLVSSLALVILDYPSCGTWRPLVCRGSAHG